MPEPQDKALSFEDFPAVTEGPIPEGEQENPFAAFPEADATVGEKLRAFGSQTAGSFAEMGGAVGGMIVGAEVGALGGPAAPVTVPLGAAIGAGAGFLAGREFREKALRIPRTEEFRPGARPFGVAGEVAGGSFPFVGVPAAAARAGARLPPSLIGNFLNRIVDFAAKSPRNFLASEMAMMGGSAAAGGTSEAFLPGQTGPRVTAEIAGGFFNPGRLIVGSSKIAMDATRRVLSTLSPAARETRAAKILQEIVQEAGEDPVALAQLLRDSGIPGVTQTSAQKTGSPALAALEAKLSRDSAKFGTEVQKTAEESLSALENMIVALRGTGDPAALTAAAELQAVRFRTLLAGRLQTAERDAAQAAAKITQDTPQARAELSKVANETLGQALKDVREVESELWSAVPRGIPMRADGVVGRFAEIRAELLPEESLPDVVEGFVARMLGKDFEAISKEGRITQKFLREGLPRDATTSGELIRFRSRALALARDAAAQGKHNDARILGQMAEAALDDLDSMFQGAQAGVLRTFGADADAYNAARAFSRELNDTFTRTFAGRAQAVDVRGAARIPPEIMLRRALGTGKEAGALRFRELEEATRFLVSRDLGGPEAAETFETMIDAQERLFRLTAAEAISPTTGRVSAQKLAKTIRDNPQLMERFPEVKADLEEALKAEGRLLDVARAMSGVSRVAEQKAAFARLAKFENASDAVRAAVSTGNKTPLKDIEGMVKIANRGGHDAREGLKAAIWEHAARQAEGTSGDFSFDKLRATLFTPIRPDQPSLIQIMEREGLMSAADVKQADRLIKEAEKISNVLSSGSDLEQLVGSPDALLDLVIRVAGARFGAGVAQAQGRAESLVAAGAGVRFARQVFDKVPQTRVRDVLIEAARDPRFAAMLLERPAAPREGLQLARRVHAYLWQAGLTAAEDQPDEQTQPPALGTAR